MAIFRRGLTRRLSTNVSLNGGVRVKCCQQISTVEYVDNTKRRTPFMVAIRCKNFVMISLAVISVWIFVVQAWKSYSRFQFFGVWLPKFRGTSFTPHAHPLNAHPSAEWRVLSRRWSRSDAPCTWHVVALYSTWSYYGKLNIALLIESCGNWSHVNCQTFLSSSMFSGSNRVAQIKIPHRTKCTFSTTVWDFYTHISWFIWDRSCYNSHI